MRKIRIGIVGLNFGRHIVADLIKTQKRLVKISALCDIETEKAEKIAREHGLKCRIFSDYGAMLREKDIDAVGLFTGPLGRAGMIRKAVDAGKHVMTTKPFEADSNAALDILEYAREKGMVLHLNSPSALPSADIKLIEDWSRRYRLGKPVAARMDVWCSYREKADGS